MATKKKATATPAAAATTAPTTPPTAPTTPPTLDGIATKLEGLSVLLTDKSKELEDLNTKFGKAVELIREHGTKIRSIESAMDEVKAAAQSARKSAVETAATSAKPIAGLEETLERLAGLETRIDDLSDGLDTVETWVQNAESDISALQKETGVYAPREGLLTRARKALSNWIAPAAPQDTHN